MESGKALHSGKNAEKRRIEALKREILVLIHDFLTEEGLFEVADVLKESCDQLCGHFKAADNMDLPLICTEFLAFYRLRFHREPVLIKKKDHSSSDSSNQRSNKR